MMDLLNNIFETRVNLYSLKIGIVSLQQTKDQYLPPFSFDTEMRKRNDTDRL
jgi:hypothetical protein